MAGSGPYDPAEGSIDWGGTGYGTGDPTSGHWISKYMPWIIGGIMGAGGLQSAGLIPGGGAAGAAGGASGAAGGPLATSVPGSYATTAYNAGAFGVPGGTAAGVGAGTAGLGGMAAAGAGAGAAGAGGAAGGTSLASQLAKHLTSAGGVASLASVIPALLAANGSGSNNFMNDPNVQALLKMSVAREQRTDPLHQAVTQLSMSMLPTAVQK